MSIVEASIGDLQAALSSGQISSVELTAKHLLRLARYDRRSIYLNSSPIINKNVFADAQASDDLRAAGQPPRSDLDGIPCTIKDSYKIKGMTVASGSPAFENLIATEDSFVVGRIKAGGGIILARTNMPPMAAGGMQRGVYGRAESPYNEDYLTAAFASGSSNGSATATAASFGLFGMGEETISSGRSPASNNGLVAYSPSRGLISIRGNWPLFPNCDTVVPHTRSMRDMFSLLDVIVAKDEQTHCDFWREQPFVPLPDPEAIRPATYQSLVDTNSLQGKVIGVPKMYIGEHDPAALPVHIRPSVRALWDQARKTLEACGATVIETDFPIVTNLESTAAGSKPSTPYFTPVHKNDIDMVQLMAYTWDDFLRSNNDTSSVTTLADVDPSMIFPPPPGALPDRYGPDDPLVKCANLVDAVKKGRVATFSIPGIGPKLQALEERRKTDFEAWMDARGLDAVVWPCQGDVGKADADKNEESARDAWRNGVLYSNGNCAIRQFGIPTINVPMGNMSDINMPVNLTFATKAYEDNKIMSYATAFEAKQASSSSSGGRIKPGRTPDLPTDVIISRGGDKVVEKGKKAPVLTISHAKRVIPDNKEEKESSPSSSSFWIEITGSVQSSSSEDSEQQPGGGASLTSLEVFVDGLQCATVEVGGGEEKGEWSVIVEAQSHDKSREDGKSVPDLALAMVIVLAVAGNGRAAAEMLFV